MVDTYAAIRTQSPPGAALPAPAPGADTGAETGADNLRLRAVAEQFEAAFLAEMLRHTGIGRMPEIFNGGPGEAAFSGTLIQEYANKIAANGALGIGDRIYADLIKRGLG